jgi:hypothetical protein
MDWKYRLRRGIAGLAYLALGLAVLYVGFILVRQDLIDSRILFPSLLLAFLVSSPSSLARRAKTE